MHLIIESHLFTHLNLFPGAS